MTETLTIGLILLVGELAVRLGITIRRSTDLERRVEKLEARYENIMSAIADLRQIVTDGGAS